MGGAGGKPLCPRLFSCPFVSFTCFQFLGLGRFLRCRVRGVESRTRKESREPGKLALICLKAHVQHTLRPEGFYLRVRLGTSERHASRPGGLPKWDGPTKPTGVFQ